MAQPYLEEPDPEAEDKGEAKDILSGHLAALLHLRLNLVVGVRASLHR